MEKCVHRMPHFQLKQTGKMEWNEKVIKSKIQFGLPLMVPDLVNKFLNDLLMGNIISL
jgi:hypothetical protein